MRIDKYDPVDGGFRAPLHAAYTGAAAAIGVGINSSGRVVAGAGQTGIVGVVCIPFDKAAGDIVDVMTDGELVEAGLAAGTAYYAHATTGVISTTASLYRVGHTVEAGRLVVRINRAPDSIAAANLVTGDQTAIVHLTDSTGGTANNTVAALPVLTDSPATADALRDDIVTNMVPVLASNFADLTAKVNAILTTLESAGLLTP